MKEFIYIMHRKDTGWHKIGKSLNPFNRLQAVQRKLKGVEVGLVACVYVGYGHKTEYYLHNHFKNFCVDGEWFDFPNVDFMTEFWEICSKDLCATGLHISPTHPAAIPDAQLSEILDNHYVLSYKYVNSQVGQNYKGTSTLAMKMQVFGCTVVVANGDKYYVTKKGQEKNLHSFENKKEMRKWLDVLVE